MLQLNSSLTPRDVACCCTIGFTLSVSIVCPAQVFEVLAGLLWLGNIQFKAKTDDSVSVEPSPAVTNAAALLQVSEPALMAALTKRNIVARGETIVTDLKMEAAVDARDALAKATYAGEPLHCNLMPNLSYST